MIFSKEMFGGADAAASLLEEPIAVIVKDINRKKYFMRSEAPARSRILPHQFGGSCTGFAGRGAAVAALLGLLCVIIDPRRGGTRHGGGIGILGCLWRGGWAPIGRRAALSLILGGSPIRY